MKHQVVRVNNLMYKGCEFTATRHEHKIRGFEEAIEIVKRGGKMNELKPCSICGEKMQESMVYLCGGTPTLIHTCINGVEIRIRADSKYDVIRNWNVFCNVGERK